MGVIPNNLYGKTGTTNTATPKFPKVHLTLQRSDIIPGICISGIWVFCCSVTGLAIVVQGYLWNRFNKQLFGCTFNRLFIDKYEAFDWVASFPIWGLLELGLLRECILKISLIDGNGLSKHPNPTLNDNSSNLNQSLDTRTRKISGIGHSHLPSYSIIEHQLSNLVKIGKILVKSVNQKLNHGTESQLLVPLSLKLYLTVQITVFRFKNSFPISWIISIEPHLKRIFEDTYDTLANYK